LMFKASGSLSWFAAKCTLPNGQDITEGRAPMSFSRRAPRVENWKTGSRPQLIWRLYRVAT
jgi:hypothetical protein